MTTLIHTARYQVNSSMGETIIFDFLREETVRLSARQVDQLKREQRDIQVIAEDATQLSTLLNRMIGRLFREASAERVAIKVAQQNAAAALATLPVEAV